MCLLSKIRERRFYVESSALGPDLGWRNRAPHLTHETAPGDYYYILGGTIEVESSEGGAASRNSWGLGTLRMQTQKTEPLPDRVCWQPTTT